MGGSDCSVLILIPVFPLSMQQECGSNYTAKLEGMFQDIDLSRECQSAFSAHLKSSATAVTTQPTSSSSSSSLGAYLEEMLSFVLECWTV